MICQLPNCNLFTLHVRYLLWRYTTSETMAPGPIFLIDTTLFLIAFIIVPLATYYKPGSNHLFALVVHLYLMYEEPHLY